MVRYGKDGVAIAFVRAVRRGEVRRPFSTADVREFAEKNSWDVPLSHLRVVLPNGSSLTHSLNYKKYFRRVARGLYELSALGESVPLD